MEKRDGIKRQILVSAPSNVAVDQLVEKLHRASLNVVRLAAKAREDVASTVDFLCLHTMVPAANPSVAKLLQLKRKPAISRNRLFKVVSRATQDRT